MLYRLLILSLFFGPGMAQGTTILVPQIGDGSGFMTEFNFVNFSSTTNRVEVRAYDNNGAPLSILSSQASPFEGQQAVDVRGMEIAGFGSAQLQTFSENRDQVKIGYAEITSTFDEPFGVEAVFRRMSPVGALITSASVLPQPLTREFSFLAFSNSFARTGIALVNPQEEGEIVVTLTLLDRFGTIVGEKTVTLPPRGKIVQFIDESTAAADLFPELAGQSFSGTMEVRASAPVAVTLIKTEGPQFFFTTQTLQAARDIF